MWVVRASEDLYIHSVNGRDSSWFRGAQTRHEAHISAGGVVFFFFIVAATTEIYTLSLHDALPIARPGGGRLEVQALVVDHFRHLPAAGDRKSTRLNSSHEWSSYAVFCLKKKQ